ncbi:MAG: hypothetical protein HY021_01670 [Burkholderiales bacterium]|nr:hypothetical protein [Burkholderiales bacterium]
METPLKPVDSPRRRVRPALFGLAVIGVGTLALLDNLHVFDIRLLRTFWPLVLVFFGIARLAWPPHMASRLFGVVLIAVGALMTAHNLGQVDINLRQWWPMFIILAGVAIALRALFPHPHRWHGRRFETSAIEHSDEVDVDATFGAVKLQNDSRNFKGGRIAARFGGVELDLREAVMESAEATLSIHAAFSGVELRVPRDWQVSVQMSATLGGVEDKTVPPATPTHRLVLRGDTVFGGVEIKN